MTCLIFMNSLWFCLQQLVLIRNGNQSQQILMFKILEQLLHLRLPLFWLKPLPRHSMTLVSLIWKKQNCRGSWRSYIFHNVSLLFFQTISMSLSLKEPSWDLEVLVLILEWLQAMSVVLWVTRALHLYLKFHRVLKNLWMNKLQGLLW